MQCDEDCRTAGFGKTERPVGWEGDGELSRVKLVRHCERGKPAGTDRLHLQALSHSFTLDFVILCRNQAEAEQALREVQEWTAAAGLKLHPEKTRVVDARQKGGFDFLGYHFERGSKWPRRKSEQKMKDRVRAITKRTNGQSLSAIITQLKPILQGWYEYFKHSNRRTWRSLDQWVRQRLRSILRKRRHSKGRGRGADYQRWPNAYFEAQGLFSFVAAAASKGQPSKR